MHLRLTLLLVAASAGRLGDALFYRDPNEPTSVASLGASSVASLGASSARTQMLKALAKYTHSVAREQANREMNTTALYKATISKMLDMSTECDLCKGNQQWLLILATRRANSKPAIDILNTIPGYHLSGDEKGVTNTLFQLYDVANNINKRNLGSDPAWKSKAISENHLLCALQLFAKELVVGTFEESKTSVIGFDEMWRSTDEKELDFVNKLFPCARFIVNEGGMDVAKNTVDLQDKVSVETLANETQQLETWKAQNEHNSFLFKQDYSVVVFNRLLHFLGVEGCQFTDVAKPHMAQDSVDKLHLVESGRTRLSGECNIHKWQD